MCGINGILDFKTSHLFPNDIHIFPNGIRKMNEILKHRGPDNQDAYIDNNISLGHTRLSIIDLSNDGNQPMQIDDTIIVFNGEIYNYIELRDELKTKGVQFHTQSDTEVLLQAYRYWGKDSLVKFNGMFAFAIWNKESKQLFCARDRFGIKPFYYMNSGSRFIFSSEIKSILSVIRNIYPNDKVI